MSMRAKLVCKKSAVRKPATALKSVFLLLLFTALMGNWVFGKVAITKPTNGTSICSFTAVGGSAPAFTTLGNIVITEGNKKDFKKGTSNAEIIISVPTGWHFNSNQNPNTVSVSYSSPTDFISFSCFSITNNSITFRWTTKAAPNGDDNMDVITISGIQVQATSTSSAAGSITYSNYSGQKVKGLDLNTTTFADLALFTSPSITTQPSNQSFCTGGSANFGVTATGSSLSYQWQYNNGGTWAGVVNGTPSGATYTNTTSATMTVAGISGAGTYNYRCYVSNSCGNATSNTATLTVNTAPAATTAGVHVPATNQIEWKWSTAADATGYKFNTTNNYATATDAVTNTSYTQTGLNCETGYTLYVWSYNTSCNSSVTTLNQATSACPVEMKVPSSGNNSYTTCSGHLYDAGGSVGAYSNGCSGYTVITPDIAGNMAQVSGSITCEGGYDYLTIYDGSGTGGTVLWGGSAHGSGISCGVFTVPTTTSTLGPLTIQFYSDVSNACSGFDLSISCYTPCSGLNTQASTGAFTNNTGTGNSITVNWTRGDGDGVIVVARPTASAAVDPVSGITYTANSAYGTAGTTTGSDNYVVYNGTGTSVNVTGLTSGTNYTFTVYEYNATGPCYKLPGSGSAVLVGYCIPSGGTLDGISGVVFNTINNINTSLNSYTNYTGSFSTTLSQGQSYNLSVFVNTGGNYTNNQKAWIDWNNDGFFNTTEGSSAGMGEEYTLGTATNVTDGISSLCPLSITVPAGSIVGSVRMRVSSAYNGYTTSCATGIDGEFEDYAVTIINPFTWTGATSTAWNIGANWLGNSVPTATSHVLIPDVTNDPQINISTAACNNMTIQSGAVVTVTANNALTVNGTLTNNAGNSGLVIESTSSGTGSLIHNTDNVPMTIQRFVTGFDYTSGALSDKIYHCVSVPLHPDNASVSGLFMGSYLYDWEPTTNAFVAWSAPTTTPMDETEGFMIFYPHSSGTTYTFAGEANNGTFTCNTSAATPGDSGFYLVPNPYPSSIDCYAASGWTKTNLENNVWIWNSEWQNYAVWNGTIGTNGGSQYIPVGQSFFVQSNAASPVLSMNNDVRVHSTTPFLKDQTSVSDILRLHVDANGSSDELVIYFDDAGIDAQKIIGFNGPPKIYSYSGTQMMAIQALPHYSQPTSVEVGFQMTVDSLVTLTASEFESFDPFLSIVLEDNLSGQLIDLRTNPVYTFAHSHSNFQNRFTVHFGNSTTSINEAAHDFSIYNSNDKIAISIPSLVGKEAMIEILDLTGRLLWTSEMTLEHCSLIPQPDVQGIVLVRVTGSTGIFTSRLLIQK